MAERWSALLGPASVEQRNESLWLSPETVEQASAALRYANEDGVRLRAAGAGTYLKRQPGVVLSTRKLTQVHEYEPADLVLSADAGTPIQELRSAAAQNNQQLALDGPSHIDATIGGTVALSAAGPLRQGYGTPRDQVLGLQLITGAGRVMNLGGRVVKNVAGYDLTRLVVGSRGALGVITRVNLRISPLPVNDLTFVLHGSIPELCARAAAVLRSTFEPVALEIIATQTGARLLVRVQGNAEVIGAARVALKAAGSIDELVGASAFGAWAQLADHELRANAVLRIGAPPAQLETTLLLGARIAGCGHNGIAAAHAGHGIVRVFDTGLRVSADAVAHLRPLQQHVARVQGSLIVEKGEWPLVEGTPIGGGIARLNRELRQVFDPNQIMVTDE